MSKARKKGQNVSMVREKIEPKPAILMELEYIAVQGRQIVFEALRKVLGRKRSEFTVPLFAHYAVHYPYDFSLKNLMTRMSLDGSRENLREKIMERVRAGFLSSDLERREGFSAVLKWTAEHQLRLGALSFLDTATMESVRDRLGLADVGMKILSIPSATSLRAMLEGWQSLVRQLGSSLGRSLALVSSAGAYRAALGAGLHCLALPDAFTAFQDFSGADAVLDRWSTESLTVALKRMEFLT